MKASLIGIILFYAITAFALPIDESTTLETSTIETTTAETDTTESSASATTEIETTFEPPVFCEDGVQFLPAPNCDQFYMCAYGIGFLHSCPNGLYWDPSLDICNWGSEHCESTSAETDTTETSASATTEIEPTFEPPVFCEDGVQFLPAPNCDQFYMCAYGIGFLHSCPNGLYWDPSVDICNWGSEHCESTSAETDTTETSASATTEIEPTFEPPVFCEDGVQFLPAPNCDQFYMCAYGIGFLHSCPNGLYWDPSLDVCSWSSEHCENDPSVPESPESDCSWGNQFLPDESDCTKYIQCVYDIGISMNCPPGLFWNQPLQRCDYECEF
ncbi:probable chitinase 10 [Drosophila montana]|uniref:probable chitinase 10 n=1 Tax=Drosophila montana TaxID=40370 RepID=UPI00313AFC6B